MELRKRALGLTLGLVWGLAVLLGTWWLLLFGYKGCMISLVKNYINQKPDKRFSQNQNIKARFIRAF
jgi:hypothetical protein